MLEDVTTERDFHGWTGGRTVAVIGNNVESKQLPFQSWRPFKEAFAPEVVHRAIKETPGTVERLLDPFGGSGTSALSSQFLGVHPTTIEVNPFLAELIEAKLSTYDIETLTTEFARVISTLQSDRKTQKDYLAGMPATFVEPGAKGRYIFPRSVADRLAQLLAAIEETGCPNCRRLFRVLAATVSLDVSNVVISGKGRRYRKNWKSRESSSHEVERLFSSKALDAIRDIARYGQRQHLGYSLLRGDSRSLISEVNNQDVAVFSPPYPNSFDYTDVYNVELWLLGHITDSKSNRSIRQKTLRSHVQIKREYESKSIGSQRLSMTLEELNSARGNLWSKDIPEMVASYFFDMSTVLSGVSSKLREKGRLYCIVGDSQYAGVTIPVAQILAEIDRSCGLQLLSSETFRSMRASPQQGGRQELPETLLIFERS